MREREFVTIRDYASKLPKPGMESCMLHRYVGVEIDFAS